MTMKCLILIIFLCLASCSTTDYDPNPIITILKSVLTRDK